MKKARYFRKYLAQLSEILVFLFVLAVFFFSLYKIVNYMGILKTDVWGLSSDKCGICEWGRGFCRQGREWCFRCWPPCPKPTPTTPASCNEPPTASGCEAGLVEYGGVCRNPACPDEVDCECPSPPGPTPTPTPPPEVPPPSDGGGPPGAPVCGASVPNAPTLLSVTSSGTGQVDLSWTDVDPASHYSIAYGLSSGDYIYGVPNTGDVTSFTVGGLDPAADYCFAVRAVHDCAPSALSNEICTGVPGRVLGVTTLADTGSLNDEIIRILFIMGSVCLSSGLGIFLSDKKAVLS